MHAPVFLQHPVNLVSLGWSYYICGFFLFAFVGWCGECLYAYFVHHHWVNRGFLNGPLCPIYGVGAMLVSLMLTPLGLDGFSLFLVGGLLCTVLEYITSVVMEKIWHLRWWDYSHSKFNVHGRICLGASIAWGVLCVLLLRLIDPFIFFYMEKIPQRTIQVIAIILLIVLALDLISTVVSSVKLSSNVKKVSELLEQLNEKRVETEKEHRERLERILSRTNWSQKRLLRAFPTMGSVRFPKGLESIRKKFAKITSDLRNDAKEEKEDSNDK